MGDYDNALARYRLLLERSDASAEVHNNLGLLYQDRGDLDAATGQFQRAIAMAPIREGAQQPGASRTSGRAGSTRPPPSFAWRSSMTRAMSSRW